MSKRGWLTLDEHVALGARLTGLHTEVTDLLCECAVAYPIKHPVVARLYKMYRAELSLEEEMFREHAVNGNVPVDDPLRVYHGPSVSVIRPEVRGSTRRGFTLDEHVAIGRRFKMLRAEISYLHMFVSHTYGTTHRVARALGSMGRGRVPLDLEKELCDEHHHVLMERIQFPGDWACVYYGPNDAVLLPARVNGSAS